MPTPQFLETIVARIERADALDKPAQALAGVVQKAVRPGPVEDVLSGVPSGHPLHPALVAVPIGAWTSAAIFDAVGNTDAADSLVALGLLGALPAAATGASDWASLHGAEQRVGFVHAVANYAAIGAYGFSWWARRRGARRTGVALSSVGALALGAAGWLGGHLSYARGVGVDTTAFEQFPTDWTDALAESDVPADGSGAVADLGGTPVLIVRTGNDLVAIADHCTHRGAPLHEGAIVDGCVTCPWHDSVFALDGGAVRSGPATRPQPAFQARVERGRVQVRRLDERNLRTDATGV